MTTPDDTAPEPPRGTPLARLFGRLADAARPSDADAVVRLGGRYDAVLGVAGDAPGDQPTNVPGTDRVLPYGGS
jgi:hypothetical protein